MLTELFSAMSRFVSVGSAAGILGFGIFFHGCVQSPAYRPQLNRIVLALACALCIAHAALLACQLQLIADSGAGSVGWRGFVVDTHVGRVWRLRAIPALALLAVGLSPIADRRKAVVGGLLAAAYLGMEPLGGHASGAETIRWVMFVNVLHVLTISAWLGALPAWLLLVRRAALGFSVGVNNAAELVQSLTRFSRLATILMALIVVSGVYLANLYINDQGDLLGTPFGLLVVAKACLLAGALYCADHLRRRFLHTLGAGLRIGDTKQALRYISVELAFGAAILACAAWLGQTTPSLHEAHPRWWLPVRWSFAATWPQVPLRGWMVAGTGAALLGIVTSVRSRSSGLRRVALGLCVLGAATTAWALAVKAYPGTFERSQVPYLSVSVANGRKLFEANCTACHGTGGLGNGPLATRLLKPPANLSLPHTALHTGGDLFWWITHGIPESGMPPFASVLSNEERWDTINFLRAFSQGFESRLLGANIVDGQAWIGAIDFYMEDVEGPDELKGYRESRNVLLCFLDASPGSRARALTLAQAYPQLTLRRTQVIVVAINGAILPAALPFPAVRKGGDELWSAYQLLSRTVADRGADDRIGMPWARAEFLIDRFGYIRGRWIAEEDAIGWADPKALYGSLERLNAEPQLKPFPDDHIH
ncbi:MAG: CopD family protein [Paraburkholderia fungorum]|nr:CopD family protein [Paraburkholderia fungorum]